MRVINPTTPKHYDADVLEACRLICGQKPISVPIKTELFSEDAKCFHNCLEKVRRDGGEVVQGWLISLNKGVYLSALFHAVWKTPDGTLVDITPPQLPSLNSERAVFLHDPNLKATMQDPRPIERRFPIKARRCWVTVATRCQKFDELKRLREPEKDREAAALVSELASVLNDAMKVQL
jgi:hypothetical protein